MADVTKPTDAALVSLLTQTDAPKCGSLWQHAKTGNAYRVVCVSLNEETLDLLVTYQRRDLPNLRWTRTLAAWAQPGRFVPWEPGGE